VNPKDSLNSFLCRKCQRCSSADVHAFGSVQAIASGQEITLEMTEEDRPGYFAAVNGRRELAEVGWLKFPKLMHIGWAAQWLHYEAELHANLSRPALVVPIFKEEVRCSGLQESHLTLC
jgi:hypothetical protein